jgi:hypothetical protein
MNVQKASLLFVTLLVLGSLTRWTSAADTTTPKSGAGDGVTCAAWGKLSREDQFVVVGSALEAQVGKPDASPFAACMWSKAESIASQIASLCTRPKMTYSKANGDAFARAIKACKAK